MKKITALLILICMISTASFAAPLPFCNSELKTAYISGKAEDSEGSVIVTIVKKGASPDDFSGAVAFGELETDSRGEYQGQFLLPSSAERGTEYSVYVSGEEDAGEFYYASEGELSGCISAFQNADADSIGSLLKEYSESKNVLGISLSGDYAKYPKWSDKAMAEIIKESEAESLTDIIEAFHKSNEAAALISGDAKEIKKALGNNLLGNEIDLSLSVDEMAKIYANSKKIPGSGDDITDTIADNLRIASAVVSVNSATRGTMREVLESFNDVLELKIDKTYEKYEADVNKALTGKDFESLSAIQKAFKSKISNLTKKPSSQSGGGSSSGGGSFGGGSGVIKLPEVDNKTEEPKTEITETVSFSDTASVSWAHDAIEKLCEMKIVSGYENGEFRPQNTVTRAEFTKLICTLAENMGALSENKETKVFEDVSESDWFAPFVKKATLGGLVNGSGNIFIPAGSITREDAAVIVYRLLNGKITFDDKKTFSDDSDVSDYAKDAVAYLAGNGIINGMGGGAFMPKGTLTRAQAAVLIYSAMSAIK